MNFYEWIGWLLSPFNKNNFLYEMGSHLKVQQTYLSKVKLSKNICGSVGGGRERGIWMQRYQGEREMAVK